MRISRKRIFAGGSALLLCVLMFFGWLSGIRKVLRERRKAHDVLAAYGSALVERNYDKAFRLTTGEQSLADFSEVYSSLASAHGPLKSSMLGAYEVDLPDSLPWSADFMQELDFRDAQVIFKCELHHEHDQWKVFGCTQTG